MGEWFGENAPVVTEYVPRAVALLWCGYVGACIGSFLHVVYHRVPLGEDIVFRSSHCPECHQPIRRRHNLPIVGWLILRGRCYDCKAAIPIRYWLFELAFGAVGIAIGWVLLAWFFPRL